MVKIDANKEYMSNTVIIRKGESELLCNQSLMLVKGTVGSAKSRLCLNMIKGLLGADDGLGLEYVACPKERHVLYISTEMIPYHLQKRYISLIDSVGSDYNTRAEFYCYHEEDSVSDLEKVFSERKPYVVFIDQVADLIPTVNDEEKSNKLVRLLSRLAYTYDTAIVLVIHQNEGSGTQSKSRGHLGSTLEQKCISSVAISKKNGSFKIQTTKVREGVPVVISAIFDASTSMLKEKNTRKDVFDSLSLPCTSGELKEQIMAALSCSYSHAEGIIRSYNSEGRLLKEKSGRNTIYSKPTDSFPE